MASGPAAGLSRVVVSVLHLLAKESGEHGSEEPSALKAAALSISFYFEVSNQGQGEEEMLMNLLVNESSLTTIFTPEFRLDFFGWTFEPTFFLRPKPFEHIYKSRGFIMS